MTYIYQTENYRIFPRSGEVHCGERITKIRARTFQLLLLLLEGNGALVDKDTILKTIWDDVNVDEQVIFQSIKELRKIFTGKDVIRTVPRKGYAWVFPVKKKVLTDPGEKQRLFGMPRAAFAAGAMIIILFLFAYAQISKNASSGGSIITLPVHTTFSDIDHRWVRYGAMDQLIQRLKPTSTIGVYQAGDVLDTLKRANIPSGNVSIENVARIFSITGASLIIQTTLSGTPRDYELFYSLHQRGDIQKGVMLARTVDGALDQLAQLVSQKTGQEYSVAEEGYKSGFANELLASALEFMQAEEFVAAEKFLAAASEAEPDNITVKRLLGKVAVAQNEFTKAQSVFEEALLEAQKTENQAEVTRIAFWSGANELQAGNANAAIAFLEQAYTAAEETSDWLFLGYIAELKGRTHEILKDFSAAKQFYLSAIDYHKIIQCPYGQAVGFMNIARLALTQGDLQTAQENSRLFQRLVADRKLQTLTAEVEAWQLELEAAVSLAAGKQGS